MASQDAHNPENLCITDCKLQNCLLGAGIIPPDLFASPLMTEIVLVSGLICPVLRCVVYFFPAVAKSASFRLLHNMHPSFRQCCEITCRLPAGHWSVLDSTLVYCAVLN